MAIMTSIVNEFAVLVPECDTTKAAHVANNLVQKISNHSFTSLEGKSLGRITISCGVATCEGDLNVFAAKRTNIFLQQKPQGKDWLSLNHNPIPDQKKGRFFSKIARNKFLRCC